MTPTEQNNFTPWFGQKRFGYGIAPKTWQGWAIVAAFVVIILTIASVAPMFGRRGLSSVQADTGTTARAGRDGQLF